MCRSKADIIEHILIQCPHARQVWFRTFQELQIPATIPTEHDELQVWWSREATRRTIRDMNNFNAMVIMSCWSLWKHRNAWVFGDTRKQFAVEQPVRKLVDEIQLWIRARRGCENGDGEAGVT